MSVVTCVRGYRGYNVGYVGFIFWVLCGVGGKAVSEGDVHTERLVLPGLFTEALASAGLAASMSHMATVAPERNKRSEIA